MSIKSKLKNEAIAKTYMMNNFVSDKRFVVWCAVPVTSLMYVSGSVVFLDLQESRRLLIIIKRVGAGVFSYAVACWM
jgi:hypothetical protein